MYERMVAPNSKNIVNTSLEGLQRVCDTKYAFWINMEGVEGYGGVVDCNIAFLTYSYTFNLAMITTGNNPYRRLLNYQ
jgi:hypothetical protein